MVPIRGQKYQHGINRQPTVMGINMRKLHKKSKCENGHLQQDVYKENVRNIRGHIIAQRFRCHTCRQTLDVDHTENLIGNPFDIVERRDEEKYNSMMNYIDISLLRAGCHIRWDTCNHGSAKKDDIEAAIKHLQSVCDETVLGM
jgi:hypothetical protein